MNRIKELRQKNNLTLKKLGDDLGIKDNTLSQYENEKRKPNTKVMDKIANYFHVSLGYVAGTENSFEESKNNIFNLILNTYIPEGMGSKREKKLVIDSLPEVDINYNILSRDILDTGGIDLSYNLDNFLKSTNLLEYEELTNSYKSMKDATTSGKKNNEIDNFNKTLISAIQTFITPLTKYVVENCPTKISSSGSNLILAYIVQWFIQSIAKRKISNAQGQVNLAINSMNNMDIVLNGLYESIQSVKNEEMKKIYKKEFIQNADTMIERTQFLIDGLNRYKSSINE